MADHVTASTQSCPLCNLHGIAGGEVVCPRCERFLGTVRNAMDAPRAAPGVKPFYDSLGWAWFGLAMLTLGFGSCASWIGLAVPFLVVAVLAIHRANSAVEYRGVPDGISKENAVGMAFLSSFGIVAILSVAAAALLGFLGVCAVVVVENAEIGGNRGAGILFAIGGLVVAPAISIYVYVQMLRAVWPKKR